MNIEQQLETAKAELEKTKAELKALKCWKTSDQVSFLAEVKLLNDQILSAQLADQEARLNWHFIEFLSQGLDMDNITQKHKLRACAEYEKIYGTIKLYEYDVSRIWNEAQMSVAYP